jgi:hypothetical protein
MAAQKSVDYTPHRFFVPNEKRALRRAFLWANSDPLQTIL